MGSIILNVPDISDDELIYNEQDTKRILKFFFPSFAVEIDAMKVNNDVRRFAQTLFIAGIDGTYALGFVKDLVDVYLGVINAGKSPGISGLAKELGKKYIKRWWKHVTQKDLYSAEIFLVIRDKIAGDQNNRMALFLQEKISSAPRNGFRMFVSDKITNRRTERA
jgi:hypothetical protein